MLSKKFQVWLVISAFFWGSVQARERWTRSQATSWLVSVGSLGGINYRPSTINNPHDMWDVGSFNADAIEEDLSKLEAEGDKSVQVFMHLRAWEKDREGYMNRLEVFLGKAKLHNIKVAINLLDYAINPKPETFPLQFGENQQSLPSWFVRPPDQLSALHDLVMEFISEMVGRFKTDERVILWNLWSQPVSLRGTMKSDAAKQYEALLPLVAKRARSYDPSQPVVSSFLLTTSPLDLPEASPWAKYLMEQSDIASFHWDRMIRNREPAFLSRLKADRIPIICTGMPYVRDESKTGRPIFTSSAGGGASIFYRWDFFQTVGDKPAMSHRFSPANDRR